MRKRIVIFLLVMMVVTNSIVSKQVEAAYYSFAQAVNYMKSKYGFTYHSSLNEYGSIYSYYLFLNNNYCYFFSQKPTVVKDGTNYTIASSFAKRWVAKNSSGTQYSDVNFSSSTFVISNFEISGLTIPTTAPTPTPTNTPTPTPTNTPTPILTNTPTPIPTNTPTPRITFRPTATPRVTATPRPTATPRLTATPRPTATIRPTYTPVNSNMQSDVHSILDVVKLIMSLFTIFPLNVILIGWILIVGVGLYKLLKDSVK